MNKKLIIELENGKIVFHPGYLIHNIMEEEEKTIEEVSKMLGLSIKEVEGLISAKISITDNMIERIVSTYGTSKTLWHNFQRDYNNAITRTQISKTESIKIALADGFCRLTNYSAVFHY